MLSIGTHLPRINSDDSAVFRRFRGSGRNLRGVLHRKMLTRQNVPADRNRRMFRRGTGSALVRKARKTARSQRHKVEDSRTRKMKKAISKKANTIIMFKVLNDIKFELAEQRRMAKETDNSESKSISQGSEYTDESVADSEGSGIGPIELEDRQTPVPKCTILHYSPFKAVWDWIVLLLVLYTAVFTPYIVAFQVNETDVRMNLNDDQATRLKNADYVIEDPLVFVDLLVDLMFIADIIINFRTTFVKDGEVISNSKQIAVHYMKGWFVIDAFAAIPFDLLFFGSGTSDTLTITGVLKLVRLFRLLRVARRADQYSQYAAATLLLMLISFALIAHWLACVFYIIAFMERKTLHAPIGWLDALAVAMDTPYLANDTTSGPDIQSRYITAMYFTMTTLTSIGFGNIAPNTDHEKLFSIFAMMIGALMSAAIFGNFSSIMMRMYQGSEEMQTKTRSIKDFISFHSIPENLSKRMHEAFFHSWSDTNGIDMNSVLKSFPEQIQADICLHLNKTLLHNNMAFKGASPGCLRALSLRFATTHAPPGDNLMHFGDIVTSIYFIARGSIEILKDDVCLAILGRGDIFGLSVDDLTSVVKSNYSVHALTFCDMNKIEAYDLQDIFDMYPEFTENFKKRFSLTFNLKMSPEEGEYKTLVTPEAMDEETLKLIRQKRPKMQCRGDALLNNGGQTNYEQGNNEVTIRRESIRLTDRHNSTDDLAHNSAIIELTPSGHGVWSPHEPPKQQTRRNSEVKIPKRVSIQSKTSETKKEDEAESSEKPTFRTMMLLAAKLQKQKDAEEAAAASRVAPLVVDTSTEDGEQVKEHLQDRSVDTEHQHKVSEEKEHLQSISDRIDECMMRVNRVEEHWNTNVQLIFQLLGQRSPDNGDRQTYI